MRRMLFLVQIPLILVWIGLAYSVFDAVPDRFPTHFDASGSPDRWSNRSILTWLSLPLIALGTLVVMYLSSMWAARRPETWNVPNKQLFLALSPAQRQPLVDMLEVMMAIGALGVNIVMAVLHYDIWRTTQGEIVGLSSVSRSVLYGFVGLALLGFPFWLWRFNTRLRELSTDAQATGA